MIPVRLLLVELEPDDLATRTLARALRDEGAEVVYTSARTAAEIAVTAAQEDVRAVGFAVYDQKVCAELAEHDGIVVFATVRETVDDVPEASGIIVFRGESAGPIVRWAGKLG